jgi:hypothetical protein
LFWLLSCCSPVAALPVLIPVLNMEMTPTVTTAHLTANMEILFTDQTEAPITGMETPHTTTTGIPGQPTETQPMAQTVVLILVTGIRHMIPMEDHAQDTVIPRIANKPFGESLMRFLIMMAALLITVSDAKAEYVAIGQIQGTVCKGFVIEVCSKYNLSAVKGSDGKMYTVSRTFDSVDEHNGDLCHIRTKLTTGGAFSWAINSVAQPVFYEKTAAGEYKELDVEYVTFKCKKR